MGGGSRFQAPPPIWYGLAAAGWLASWLATWLAGIGTQEKDAITENSSTAAALQQIIRKQWKELKINERSINALGSNETQLKAMRMLRKLNKIT